MCAGSGDVCACMGVDFAGGCVWGIQGLCWSLGWITVISYIDGPILQ